MKIEKVDAWKCQICKNVYAEKNHAVDCSKLHATKKDLKVIDARWDLEINDKYPSKILVEEIGGEAAEYTFRYASSIEDFYEEGKGWE